MRVHFLVSSPPVGLADSDGIHTPRPDELVTFGMSIEETRRYVAPRSLAYPSYNEMSQAADLPEDRSRTSGFRGDYSVDIGTNATISEVLR